MTRSLIRVCAVLAAILPSAAAYSHDNHNGDARMSAMKGDIAVSDAWARATPGHTPNGGAYLTLTNHGKTADRLVSAATNVARRAELHTHVMDGGIMRMRPVEGGVEVPAGGTVAFKPGGYHVMLMGLRAPLKEGDVFPLTLRFAKAGVVTVSVHVRKVGAMGPGGQMDHMENMKR